MRHAGGRASVARAARGRWCAGASRRHERRRPRSRAADGESLVFVDLARGTEADPHRRPPRRVTGVDWSPDRRRSSSTARSARAAARTCSRMDPNGAEQPQPDHHRRRSRAAPAHRPHRHASPSTSASRPGGKGRIFIFLNRNAQLAVTTGGPGSERAHRHSLRRRLATPIPTTRPTDARSCSGGSPSLGNGGLGTWDMLTVRSRRHRADDDRDAAPVYRGAPDWGPRGIVFSRDSTRHGPDAASSTIGRGRHAAHARSRSRPRRGLAVPALASLSSTAAIRSAARPSPNTDDWAPHCRA